VPALLLAVLAICATSCGLERGETRRLRKLAATLPVPDGADLVDETFDSSRHDIFGPEVFHGTLTYKTRADVTLKDALEKVIGQFEASGWTAQRQDAEFVHENPVAHRASVRFEKAGNVAMAYLSYDFWPHDPSPLKVPARAWINLTVGG
jgi:hypothetical protein